VGRGRHHGRLVRLHPCPGPAGPNAHTGTGLFVGRWVPSTLQLQLVADCGWPVPRTQVEPSVQATRYGRTLLIVIGGARGARADVGRAVIRQWLNETRAIPGGTGWQGRRAPPGRRRMTSRKTAATGGPGATLGPPTARTSRARSRRSRRTALLRERRRMPGANRRTVISLTGNPRTGNSRTGVFRTREPGRHMRHRRPSRCRRCPCIRTPGSLRCRPRRRDG
jgi:hypothetical protein